MAYLSILASVPESRIQAFRKDSSISLGASLVEECSHLIAYWVEIQPVGRLLGDVIDGGQPLHEALWHPLRPPVFHNTHRTKELAVSLKREWSYGLETHPVPKDDWYRVEIEKVLAVVTHAAEGGECFVSLLEPPMDAERARRVAIPRLG
jgi:hypothetical protein